MWSPGCLGFVSDTPGFLSLRMMSHSSSHYSPLSSFLCCSVVAGPQEQNPLSPGHPEGDRGEPWHK